MARKKKIDFGKYSYRRIKLKSPGRQTVYSANNADAVSRAMFLMNKDELIETVTANRLTPRLQKHFTKNTGHLRMVVGGALRSKIHKGNVVTVRGITITSLQQVVEWPFGYVEHKYPKVDAPCG